MKRKRANLFGFGKKPAASSSAKRSSMTISQSVKAAYRGGQKSGDTGLFKSWLKSKGLDLHGKTLQDRLEKEYRRGVEDGEVKAPSATKTLKKERATSAIVFKGVKIRKTPDGEFVTSIEPESRFESLKDAKAFIVSVKKNPKTKTIRLKLAGNPGKREKGARGNPSLIASLKQGRATASVYRTKPIGADKYKVRVVGPKGQTEETFSKFGGAMSFARLRLHEMAENPVLTDSQIQRLIPGSGPTSVLLEKFHGTRAKKNPMPAAQKMYEEFHGLPSQEELEYVTQEHIHSVTAGIGKLVCIDIVTVDGKKNRLTAPGFSYSRGSWSLDPKTPLAKTVQVTVSEDGRQLFFVGGDQKIDLTALGLTKDDAARDHVFVGTIVELTYRTRKTFESQGKEEVDFYHAFGKEGSKGVCPLLMYKPRNPSMQVYGGRYQIAAPSSELKGVSPGIIG